MAPLEPNPNSQPPPLPSTAPPIMSQARLSTDAISAMLAEYRHITASRRKWRILSLVFGAGGLVLLLLAVPTFDRPNLSDTQRTRAAISSFGGAVLLGLGLAFSAKYKGRGLAWGLSAIGIRSFRRASETDLLEQRLAEMKRTLEAHGIRV